MAENLGTYCDLCGTQRNSGQLKRVLIDREWVWECTDDCPPKATVADNALAALAEIRDRNEQRIAFHCYTEYTVEHDVAEGDVRRLLAVLGKVLKLADGWEADAGESRTSAARKLERGNAIPAWISEASADAREDCVQTLRETITRELTGEEDHA